uniref:F5/8 type C domain-containing protein n=1 Tax=Anabas testudineus TaxID=64144 RepID=A0A3Q1IYW4_ANATE
PSYKKVVFREYEKGFKQAKTHPSWLGLLGPTLRAEEGEMIVVTFRNMATGPHSIHPHGVAYGKQSEGAHYFDNTSQKEKEDDVVQPNTEHVYYWEVTSDVSPQSGDPTCLTYTYVSHQDVVRDYNSGLIGTLLICKTGKQQNMIDAHQEYVFLFGIFDERVSKYKPNSQAPDNHVKYTINGYTSGSLPDVTICAHTSVSLHLVGMSSEPEVFSVHMNGHVLQQTGHKVSSVGLISGSSATANMTAFYPGRWMLSSRTFKHIEAGMHGFVDVKKCDGFEATRRKLTIEQKRQSREWKYYIAAEEIVWDYAPQIQKHVDEDFKHLYLKQSPTRIGPKYKKAVYYLYNNESFTERLEDKHKKSGRGLLGPVIRAQVRDIVFKNMASRPYSIYPHGLTIDKSAEGHFSLWLSGNQSHGVLPGETRTYVWRVAEEDEPLEGDARCVTRMYHSAVDTPRDIASGLIGPLLICRSQSLNVRNVQVNTADKEQHAMFAVFDENKSWYLDYNIRQYCDRSKVNKADLDFYKSNVMHTINGYAFESGPVLGFCNGEVATWHVSSVGAQDYIQTATFYGHPFMLNERTEDFLSLYPMTGETITMKMDNIGIWLMASLNSHGTTKGMRVKFRDVECYRDYQYDYSEEEVKTKETKAFSFWNPATLDDIKKAEEKPKPVQPQTVEIDIYTDMFADELGLRSRKNQSTDSDAELLDLSVLDYDVINVPDKGININISTSETQRKNETSTPKPKTLDKTLFSIWNEVDGIITKVIRLLNMNENSTSVEKHSAESMFNDSSVFKTENETFSSNGTEVDKVNLTVVNSLNRSVSENTTHAQNSITEPTFTSFSANKTENTSVVLLKKDSVSDDVSNLINSGMSDTRNTTFHDAVASSVMGNVSAESANLTVTLNETTPTAILSSVLELDSILVEDSKEKLTRGDVFSYSVPLHGAPEHNVSVLTVSQREDENKTATNHINRSADATNHLLSIQTADVGDVNINNTDSYNLTAFKLTDNKTNVNGSLRIVPELQYELQMNSSEVLINSANSSLENVTDPETETQSLQNVTVNTYTSNSSEEISSESRENITASQSRFNHTSSIATSSNETRASGSLSLSKSAVKIYTSEDLGASDSSSSEEVFVYLKESNTQVIQTTSVKTQGHNWTYDGTHQMVPLDIPDHRKYFENETPQKEPAPKKKKTVILRQRPLKGQSMKTKKKKQYQPQARSGLPFSPRGFNPGMTPRGTRPNVPQPVSDEQQLINSPVVIGLPRADFSDYEMYIPGEQPRHIELGGQDVTADEYEYVTYIDPYSGHDENKNLNLDETIKYFLKYSGPNVKTYFIAAEEVEWDYKSDQSMREMTTFTKVVFRGYMDSSFSTPDVRGELDEHLGILGPVIKAEVGQSIIVVFRNNANRPYSIHPNGVSYTKQSEGLSYDDGSQSWYEYDNEVQPNTTFTYSWKVSSSVGPLQDESNCRTWAYYSGVNPERDIHSGLIGPLLVCREGTLDRNVLDTREFVLLFMTFDESQSWYYEKNKNQSHLLNMLNEHLCVLSIAINGIIYNLKGLRMYTNQLVCWHLINMGSPRDFHSVHFHGQTFLHKKATSYRHAVYPLLPGSFATLEMRPTKPGLWQLETEVGFNQQNGMQTLFLVLNNDCYHPLGMESGSVKDEQITAINTRGYWGPHLARLNNQGQFNAWSTEVNNSWIQVDFQRPVVISQVATQGARQLFQTQFVDRYSISYSTDRRKWIFYKGDSRGLRKVFTGNQENSDTKRNTFFPPLIGRFIRLHPINWYNKATVRMEFYGCELDGCSVPLGMESGLIEDHHITASSTASSWYGGPWKPSFARLNRQGTINAWQAKYNDMYQWLQVELPQVKKITGIVTQGAKALRKEMYVMSYSLQYSDNGIHWNHYTDDENVTFKTFPGNTNNSDHVKNYIYPPIFSRFIRIIPRTWWVSLTMRIELLGCDFE